MKLSAAQVDKSYKVISFGELPEETLRRLESLGMTRGVVVSILNSKSKGTLIVRFREGRYALGRSITEKIEVDEYIIDSPDKRPHHTLALD